jgi:hypothetical protein
MASPFSGKQSHVTFLEIPGQNKKSLKHNECHNLMREKTKKYEENRKAPKFNVKWLTIHEWLD